MTNGGIDRAGLGGAELRAMKLRLIMKGILITMACLCMVIVLGFFALSFLLWHNARRHPSYQDMKAQAVSAIVQVGGVDILEKEAKYLVDYSGAARNTFCGIPDDAEKTCPLIEKLSRLLEPPYLQPPYGTSGFWMSRGNLDKGIPDHVEVGFGTHSYRFYVWIFDGEHKPTRQIEGLEHLTSTVYLANERFLADKKEQKKFDVNSASQTRD